MKNFLRKWNELLSLPVAIVVWYFTPYLLIRLDPEAGSYDIGVIQSLFLATVALYFGKTIVWLLLKLGAPHVYATLDDYLLTRQKYITEWEKGKFSLYYFFGLFFCWVLLVLAFM